MARPAAVDSAPRPPVAGWLVGKVCSRASSRICGPGMALLPPTLLRFAFPESAQQVQSAFIHPFIQLLSIYRRPCFPAVGHEEGHGEWRRRGEGREAHSNVRLAISGPEAG